MQMFGKREYFATSVHVLVFGLIAAVGGMFAIAQVVAPPQPPAPRAKDNAPDTQQAAQQAQAAGQRQPANAATREAQPRTEANREQGGTTTRQQPSSARQNREGRASDAAWLGVYLQGNEDNQSGARVMQVYPAGPAARAGFQPGDVITSVNGQAIAAPQELISAIEALQPQSRAEIVVRRGNQDVKLTTVLGSRDSFIFRSQGEGEYGENSDSNEDDFYSNVPPYAMQMEHDRRMAEQHQRIEEELRKLQEEVRQLREAIQAKK
jgi:membrane-associated protease RseP (regulator of RpoE activity)